MITLKATFARLLPRLPVSSTNPWKIALFVGVFLLPGGTLGVLALAWIEHQRARRAASARPAPTPLTPQLPAIIVDEDHRPCANEPMSLCANC